MNSGVPLSTGDPGGIPPTAWLCGRQARADEARPGLPPPQRSGDAQVPVGAGQRRPVHERRLDIGEALFVVAGQVQAQVIVVDRGQLEVRQAPCALGSDSGAQDALEVRGPQPAVNSSPSGLHGNARSSVRSEASSRRAPAGEGVA